MPDKSVRLSDHVRVPIVVATVDVARPNTILPQPSIILDRSDVDKFNVPAPPATPIVVVFVAGRIVNVPVPEISALNVTSPPAIIVTLPVPAEMAAFTVIALWASRVSVFPLLHVIVSSTEILPGCDPVARV